MATELTGHQVIEDALKKAAEDNWCASPAGYSPEEGRAFQRGLAAAYLHALEMIPAEPAQPAPQAGAAEFVTLPKTPTLAMKRAMHQAAERPLRYSSDISKDSWFDQPERMYAAAIAAHPTEQPSQDAEALDWLETMTVNVRIPLRYGSHDLFWATPEERDGEAAGPSDIRAKIAAARAAQAQGESTGGTPHG